MRTTIRIDDELYKEVKAKAARSGRTVAAVIEDAIRRGLRVSAQRAAMHYEIRPTGQHGLQPGVDLSSNSAVAELMDEGISLDALR